MLTANKKREKRKEINRTEIEKKREKKSLFTKFICERKDMQYYRIQLTTIITNLTESHVHLL